MRSVVFRPTFIISNHSYAESVEFLYVHLCLHGPVCAILLIYWLSRHKFVTARETGFSKIGVEQFSSKRKTFRLLSRGCAIAPFWQCISIHVKGISHNNEHSQNIGIFIFSSLGEEKFFDVLTLDSTDWGRRVDVLWSQQKSMSRLK